MKHLPATQITTSDQAVTETLLELDPDDICPVFWVNVCCNVANALCAEERFPDCSAVPS